MKPFICIAIAIVATCNISSAAPGTPSKVSFPKAFTEYLKEAKHLYEPAVAKVCACQILRVESKNEQESLIAVFAQGNNTGDLSSNFAAAITVLEKEKKHLKTFFYTRIQTTENVTAAGECSSLYKNLKVRYANVKLYDVLDADALNNRRVVQK